MSKLPAIVIVPGAWHFPKHYQRLLDRLAAFNYEAVGVSLPSVNSSPALPSWDQDAQAIRREILGYLDKGQDVVAVAHSFGGIAMSEAVKDLGKEAREKQGLQGGVLRLVYMCAIAPLVGQTHISLVKPHTPEEEEIERKRQEQFGHMQWGMKFTEVCTYYCHILSIYFFSNFVQSLMVMAGWSYDTRERRCLRYLVQ